MTIFHEYDRIISDQLDKGTSSRVAEMEEADKISYLPHSAVLHQNAETTKARVIYDASCMDKTTKTSLNDYMHVGPSLSPLIFDLLVRFRDTRAMI